jgi:lipid-binding SYLF domain-containing protein
MLIAFLSDTALDNFIHSNGWEAGVDGTITVSDWGKSKDLTSFSFEKPIIAFIYGEKGYMASISIAGTKFRRIAP